MCSIYRWITANWLPIKERSNASQKDSHTLFMWFNLAHFTSRPKCSIVFFFARYKSLSLGCVGIGEVFCRTGKRKKTCNTTNFTHTYTHTHTNAFIATYIYNTVKAHAHIPFLIYIPKISFIFYCLGSNNKIRRNWNWNYSKVSKFVSALDAVDIYLTEAISHLIMLFVSLRPMTNCTRTCTKT